MTIDVVKFFQSLRSDFFDFFFNSISFIGEEYVYILVLAIVYFGISQKKGEFLVFILFFTGIFNTWLKGIFTADRPFEKFPDEVINLRPETSPGHSFPSGHTQNFTAFLMSGAILLKKKRYFVIAITLSLLMAISRMYLGVHFLEDVVVSLILGLITAYVGHYFFEKYYDKRFKVYILIGLIGIVSIIFINDESYLKAVGYYLGFVGAMIFNDKVIQYTFSTDLKKRIMRVVVGIVLIAILQIGFGLLGIENFYLKLIRNMVIVFTGFGLYPLFIKKINF